MRNLFRSFKRQPQAEPSSRLLQYLHALSQDRDMFSLTRKSMSRACFIGLFFCFIPLPGQMALVTVCAILFRANLPFALFTVWFSNPFTYIPMLYVSYKLGCMVLGLPTSIPSLDYSLKGVLEVLYQSWEPLFLGSIILGLISGVIGFLVIELLWRFNVRWKWHVRQKTKS